MKRIAIFLLAAALPGALFAGTLLEQSLKGYDPFLADRDGFDSLFVNPAGISGTTEAFSLDVEGGTWGKLDNYKLLRDNKEAIGALAGGSGSLTQENVDSLMPLMAGYIDQATLDAITSGTSVSTLTLSQAQDSANWAGLSAGDLSTLASNASSPAVQQAIMDQFSQVNYNLEAELRTGTLINGIGFGIYNNDYALFSLGAQGIEDLVVETGAVAGYGFDMGPFSLGFSGKFALILADDPMYPFNVNDPRNQQILYGYAWGVDAGAIWEPFQGFRVAVLLSDIIGSVTPVEDMASGTLGDFLAGNVAGPSGGYAFNFDVGTGVTWQPEWKGLSPKFSLDFYDIVGLVREVSDASYSGVQDFYMSDASPVLRHLRAGASLRILGILDLAAGWYQEYITVGAGVDAGFIQAFLELKTKQNFSDVGADAMIKLSF